MIKITLTDEQVYYSGGIGLRRQLEAMKRGLKDKPSVKSRQGWTIHIEGAAAELAGCLALGIDWPASINTGKQADASIQLEFKRRIESWYDLTIRNGDLPDRIYVLVTGKIPNFVVVGWIRGRDGMKPEYWGDPNGNGSAWFVPQSKLHGLDKLMFLIRAGIA